MNDIIVKAPIRNFRIGRGNTFHNVRTGSSGKKSVHQGLDFSPEIPGVPGQPIEPSIDGTIVFQGKVPGFGNNLTVETVLADGRHLYTSYNHLQDQDAEDVKEKRVGTRISSPLGKLGSSGASSLGNPVLPHLHFETIVADGKLDFSNEWPLEKGGSGTAGNGVNWKRISPQFEAGGMIITSTPNGVRATLKSPWAATAPPPAEPFTSFDNRFSAIGSSAAAANDDGSGGGIGGRPHAATYDNRPDDPAAGGADHFGPGIPFASRPTGSLATSGGSSLLDPAPLDVQPGPFPSGVLAPPPLSSRPLYPTGVLVHSSNRPANSRGVFENLFGSRSFASAEESSKPISPVLRELQKYKASTSPDPVASGGVLKWIGKDVPPSTVASTFEPFVPSGRVVPDLPDKNIDPVSETESASPPQDKRRYLSRRIANRESAFDSGAPAVPFAPSSGGFSSDRPNAFEDRVGNWLPAADVVRPAPAQQASLPFETLTGKPLSDWLLPPSIFGFPDRVSDGLVDARAPQDVRGTGIPMLEQYIRYLNREYPA